MLRITYFVLFVVFSNASYAASPCQITDSNCLQKTISNAYSMFMDAIPEYGMEEMDPMHHNFIDGNLSILKFKLYNSTVVGFRKCKPENTTFSDEHKIHLDLLCPKLLMHGKYDIHGRLIILPVEGNGNYEINTNNFRLSIEAEAKTEERDGYNYMSIKNFRLNAEALEPVKFDFQNLFNGQQDLANAVLKFANENWREVSAEVQAPVLNEDVKKIIKNANKYFKHIPLEELLSVE